MADSAAPPMEPPPHKSIWSRVSRYGILSVVSFVYIAGALVFLKEVAGLHPSLSYAIALATVLALNFTAMRFWVYADTRDNANWRKQFLATLGISCAGRAVEWVVYTLLVYLFPTYYLLWMLVVNSTSFVVKFFLYHSLVFGKKQPQPATPPYN